VAAFAAPEAVLWSGGNHMVLEETHITGCASNGYVRDSCLPTYMQAADSALTELCV
jgi:hypothetical protein